MRTPFAHNSVIVSLNHHLLVIIHLSALFTQDYETYSKEWRKINRKGRKKGIGFKRAR